ncbi:MAG: transcription termination factor Rho [Lachnospiraceae bacterium]|nr:transcription termination factor Rho [Lachnospiraceae bacterium]
MSVDLNKQSLSTLKEWAQALGIRGMSNARKGELVSLLSQVGEARIEHAIKLTGEREEVKPRGRKKAVPQEATPKVAEKEEKPEKVVKRVAPAARKEAPPTEAFAETEVRETPPRRPAYRRSYEGSSAPRSGGRGGFGSYSPTYRAQAEAIETQDRNSRSQHYEMPAPERRRSDEGRGFYGEKKSDEPRMMSAERSMALEKEGLGYPDALAGPLGSGILEVMPEGFGFIRCENYMPGDNDIYVSPAQIHRFGLKTGDVLTGVTKIKTGTEKFPALLYINTVNDESPENVRARKPFEDLTPVFPHERIHLETQPEARAMRIVNLMAPVGKGQRGMIVSPPKAGKTTLIKEVAKAVTKNHPDMQLIILLIDERPEEVTDIKEDIEGPNVEVIYSTFDETPEHHKRVAEMVLGRAQRLVEHGRDVIILLDSITRLSRAYNLTVAPSGRTLSGGLDPAALHMPKKFFGSARCMREGGSLTVLATALVDTGSRMDDVVYEEFKGTGNMELVLDRRLSERRIFPAVDILKSGTRRDDLLLTKEEMETVAYIRQAISNPLKGEEALEKVLDLMRHTRTNREFCALIRKMRF